MKKGLILCFGALFLALFAVTSMASAQTKPRIAVFAGPTATIHNSPALITSNKARAQYGLPLLTGPDGRPAPFDPLVPQRLAAPVEVLIEQFSAHPLEKDAVELYGPPDGYVDRNGAFSTTRTNPDDRPVYKATLRPEDGLYLLPYMARQTDGKAWNSTCTFPGAPFEKCRQTFYPDGSRLFEEINRTISGRTDMGMGNILSAKAEFDHYRAVPSGGYTKGLPEAQRTDVGEGSVPKEVFGEDFFGYGGNRVETRMVDLARATNVVQKALRTGIYAGAIWLEGSPPIPQTLYWFNLLIDTNVPICGNAGERVHGQVGNEGDRNIIDSTDYILSKAWADKEGRDAFGSVLIIDTQVFAPRQTEKQGARPGGYVTVGGHGGILGTIGDPGAVTLWFKPTTLHTWQSAVNMTRLPGSVHGIKKVDGKFVDVEVKIKDDEGYLRPEAIPKVTSVRWHRWLQETSKERTEDEVEIMARIEKNLKDFPLAGFVLEGMTPYGTAPNQIDYAMRLAAMSGMPVVRVGQGDMAGLVPNLPYKPYDYSIEGNNLPSEKARLLLMAAMMKFGSLAPARDPRNPTPEEVKAIQAKIKQYQEVFNTH